MKRRFEIILLAWLAASSALGCDDATPEGPTRAVPGPGEGGAGHVAATTGGSPAARGGAGHLIVHEGVGLTSAVFGSLDDIAPDGDAPVAACDYGDAPACDFTRTEGCCAHLGCARAGDDPDDPHPMQSCQALLACVQANPGCSTASDPVCFQDEAPTAPCLMQGYGANHDVPDGPFWHTVELMRCLCGY